MASLTVRQLDDKLKTLLRLRAARHGRSMEDEVRVILREAAEHATGEADGPAPHPEAHTVAAAPADTARSGAAAETDCGVLYVKRGTGG